MNEIVSVNELDFNSMSPEQLRTFQTRLLVAQVEKIQDGFAKYEFRQGELERKVEDAIEIAKSNSRPENSLSPYMTQSEFGEKFAVKISNRYVGRLLIAIGLAFASGSESLTTPYDKNVTKYAVNKTQHRTFYKWHYENCIKYLDNWLNKNELSNQFYSISDREEMQIFINKLLDRRA